MQVSQEEWPFLKRILARPWEDGPRLIFADWLDEHDDPRGELIRIQCALAHLPRSDPQRNSLLRREQQLLETHQNTWTAPIRGLVQTFEFRRGLLEAVVVEADRFLQVADALFQVPTIRRIRLTETQRILGMICQSEYLSLVRELDLCGNDLGNAGVNVLSRSPYLQRLEVLDLSFNAISDNGLQAFARSAKVGNLRELTLNDNSLISDHGILALANAPTFARLHALDISYIDLSNVGVRGLVESPYLRKLQRLEMVGNHIGDAGLAVLASSNLLQRMLRHAPVLHLASNTIGPAGIDALMQSPYLELVEELDLRNNPLGDEGFARLLMGNRWKRLRRLLLRNTRLTDAVMIQLADSPLLSQLEYLDLTKNAITKTGLEWLVESEHFSWRTVIDTEGIFLDLRRPRSASGRHR